MLESPLLLSGLLTGLAALAFWLEKTFSWAQKIGASLLIILFGALVSNAKLVPESSVVYDILSGPVTSLAIVWLLFGVKLKDLRDAGLPMIKAFFLGVVGTVLGALAATLSLASLFPENASKLAGVLTGTYSGGSLNFVSVGRAVDLPETLFAAAAAADNLVTGLWMGATLVLPLWLARFYPSRRRRTSGPAATSAFAAQELHLFDLAALLALGLLLVWGTEAASAAGLPGPSVLWLTTAALVMAQLRPVQRLRGSLLLGVLALNFFFVVMGVGSRLAKILEVGPEILYLTLAVVAVHGVVVFGAGRLLGLDVETLAVASQAAIGGPSTAIALTTARGWHDLMLPGLAVGLLGYAVGTFSGIGIWTLTRWLLSL